MFPQKSLFQRLVESAALFALACWLVKTGVLLIESVWGWIILLSTAAGIVVIIARLYKHYRNTKF